MTFLRLEICLCQWWRLVLHQTAQRESWLVLPLRPQLVLHPLLLRQSQKSPARTVSGTAVMLMLPVHLEVLVHCFTECWTTLSDATLFTAEFSIALPCTFRLALADETHHALIRLNN